ncbi:sensor histidine kinase [Chitinimonas lacunae]|uniref:histidine kinase n=1 Tax=Chitinimonas lacunae TaxID=1963018 RepID=A0ABV8MTL4_9NEIS
MLIWLLLPQLVLLLAAAAASYYIALRYTNVAIDQSLAQSSRALARQVKPFGDGLFIDFPRAAREILEEDPNDRLYYMVSTPPGQFILGDNRMPPPPEPLRRDDGTPHFYDGYLAGQAVRVAALQLRIGTPERRQTMLVQVAKSTVARTQLAREILTVMLTPLALLLLATSLIVRAGIGRGLAPLQGLRNQVENRSPRDLTPIEVENAPTEVRSLAAALNTLLGEVKQQVASHKRFIADAAHQLRTPLAGLKSQTELALREIDEAVADPAALRQRLARLEASADRGIRLVNQLLALARAEPDAPLARAPLDLARLLRDLGREAVPRALARQLDLAVDGAETPVMVVGHEGLLRELFANLIDNAIAYTPGGGEVVVRLEGGPHPTVEVRDTGPGIPAEELERVFERFYRGAAQANARGCGLGLPIAREIARRHQATVELERNQPHGLVARVRFTGDDMA